MDTFEITPIPESKRADGNLSALAGEFFVAAELLKREVLVSITFGNAKHVDLLAINKTGKKFSIQVKTLRTKGYFPVRKIVDGHIYVFVVLNKPGQAIQYFIAPAESLRDEPDLKDPKVPGIRWQELDKFKEAWNTFGC
jgi:hypothetical protein